MTLDQIETLLNRSENGNIEPAIDEYREALKALFVHVQQMLTILDDNIGRGDDPYDVLKDLQHEYVCCLYRT